jgi:hypothetical protein
MAGVFEQILRPRRQLIRFSIPASRADERILELQVAMEILAEIFGTDVSEIDMMLKQRYEERLQGSSRRARQEQPFLKHRCDEAGQWPMEFCLAE